MSPLVTINPSGNADQSTTFTPHPRLEESGRNRIDTKIDDLHLTTVVQTICLIMRCLNPGMGSSYTIAPLPKRVNGRDVLIVKEECYESLLKSNKTFQSEINKYPLILSKTNDEWNDLMSEINETVFSEESKLEKQQNVEMVEAQISRSVKSRNIYSRIKESVKYVFDNDVKFRVSNLKQQVLGYHNVEKLDFSLSPLVRYFIFISLFERFKNFSDENSPVKAPALWSWDQSLDRLLNEKLKASIFYTRTGKKPFATKMLVDEMHKSIYILETEVDAFNKQKDTIKAGIKSDISEYQMVILSEDGWHELMEYVVGLQKDKKDDVNSEGKNLDNHQETSPSFQTNNQNSKNTVKEVRERDCNLCVVA